MQFRGERFGAQVDETERTNRYREGGDRNSQFQRFGNIWYHLFLLGTLGCMTDVTNILGQIENGDPSAVEKLLPLVYEELRKLAAARMALESPDHTLQATALVHEAYMRLVDVEKAQKWNSRGHFFGAAAEAMRRILVEAARKKNRLKHGGGRTQIPLAEDQIPASPTVRDVLEIDEALTRLSEVDELAARFVELRFFAGMTVEEAAGFLEMPVRSAYDTWNYAKTWLQLELKE